MNICIFSDIHGNQYALNQFFHTIKDLNIDYYIFCGDIFGYYYGQKKIIERLSQLKDLLCVRGNHDQFALEVLKGLRDKHDLIKRYGSSYNLPHSEAMITFLEAMPLHAELTANGLKIGVFHGSPENCLEGRIYPNADFGELSQNPFFSNYKLVITGHTHYRHFIKKNGVIFLNPGSLGQARDNLGSSFSIFNTVTLENQFYSLKWEKDLLFDEINKKDKMHPEFKDVFFREELGV